MPWNVGTYTSRLTPRRTSVLTQATRTVGAGSSLAATSSACTRCGLLRHSHLARCIAAHSRWVGYSEVFSVIIIWWTVSAAGTCGAGGATGRPGRSMAGLAYAFDCGAWFQ